MKKEHDEVKLLEETICLFGSGGCPYSGFERCKSCASLSSCICPKEGFLSARRKFLGLRKQIAYYAKRLEKMKRDVERGRV
jgi:hypothetical protein